MTSCFVCGKEIPPGALITVEDHHRKRTLHFCSQACKENQKDSHWHYLKFPHTREHLKRIAREEEPFEEFIEGYRTGAIRV